MRIGRILPSSPRASIVLVGSPCALMKASISSCRRVRVHTSQPCHRCCRPPQQHASLTAGSVPSSELSRSSMPFAFKKADAISSCRAQETRAAHVNEPASKIKSPTFAARRAAHGGLRGVCPRARWRQQRTPGAVRRAPPAPVDASCAAAAQREARSCKSRRAAHEQGEGAEREEAAGLHLCSSQLGARTRGRPITDPKKQNKTPVTDQLKQSRTSCVL